MKFILLITLSFAAGYYTGYYDLKACKKVEEEYDDMSEKFKDVAQRFNEAASNFGRNLNK